MASSTMLSYLYRPSNASSCLLSRLSICPKTQTRSASHASQGRANKAAPGPGKRLGAKKGDSELVVPGNIIFRQRGSKWFPGENCVMGRDHTISALQKGFVRYYRDPDRHPDRKYIGVVFEQYERLPRPANAPRRRRLGMDAVLMKEPEKENTQLTETITSTQEAAMGGASYGKRVMPGEKPILRLRDNYSYRESNTSIGRTAERAGVKIKEFKPRNRWLAWRKTNARRAANAERRALRRK